MSSSKTSVAIAMATQVAVTDNSLSVDLTDGRTITVPIVWFPRLQHGTVEERNHWQLIGNGHGIHWPDLDEDIRVEGLLLGQKSSEGAQSLAPWLTARSANRVTS